MTQEAKVLSAIGIATVLILIGAVVFLSRDAQPKPIDPSVLVREDSHKISSDSAKLTIVEFGDYECPACGLAHPGLKQALTDFSGQVNFVYRHFPLMQHPNAEEAGAAAEAAGMQGKYWEMHNILYERQDEWAQKNNVAEFFKKYASELGLNVEKFTVDMDSDQAKNKVRSDLSDGTSLGVNSTPTFFFNGELHRGGVGYQDFKSKIENYLK